MGTPVLPAAGKPWTPGASHSFLPCSVTSRIEVLSVAGPEASLPSATCFSAGNSAPVMDPTHCTKRRQKSTDLVAASPPGLCPAVSVAILGQGLGRTQIADISGRLKQCKTSPP